MCMKRDNRGVSLVELIVVIAIMAIMVGVGVLSISLLFGTQARGCAQKVSSMLNETKTGCLSRFDETMTLTYCVKEQGGNKAFTADGYYAINKVYTIKNDATMVPIGNDASAEVRSMGSGNVVITVYLSNGKSFTLDKNMVMNTDMNADMHKQITISYNRATGAFDPVIVDDVQTGLYIDKITFASGARTYTITMVKETGKHTLEG